MVLEFLKGLVSEEQDPPELGPLIRRLERDPTPFVMRKAMSVLYKAKLYRECQILLEIYCDAGCEMTDFVVRTQSLLDHRRTFSYTRLRSAMLAQTAENTCSLGRRAPVLSTRPEAG